jgi:hypothetical protein
LLKTLDNIWFTIKDKLAGYNSGYTDGIRAGYDIAQGAVEAKLYEHDLQHANEAFQLGYAHAVAVVKGEI